MNNTANARDPLRYRFYYWVLNANLVAMLIGIIFRTAEFLIGLDPEQFPVPIQIIVGPLLVVFIYIASILLIAVSWWRDEYVETLWKRTVGQVVLFFTIVPPILMVFVLIVYFVSGGEDGPDWPKWLFDDERPILLLTYIWEAFVIAFVVLLQINRWRDSR